MKKFFVIIVIVAVLLIIVWPRSTTIVSNIFQIPEIKNQNYHDKELAGITIENAIVYHDNHLLKNSDFLVGYIENSEFDVLMNVLMLQTSTANVSDCPRVFEFVSDEIRNKFINGPILDSFHAGFPVECFEGMHDGIYWSGMYDVKKSEVYIYIGY